MVYLYAQLDADDLVIGVSQLSGEVLADYMIAVPEYDPTLIGKEYDRSTQSFVDIPAADPAEGTTV